ncbi:hypothetical protein FRX31_012493 [Thalictrum thalictroides]|uniref:Uncharacterized protein n=1 Tax=Thalictrum thalictroides TaxID=46969 RepID=A0A7J6WKK6_THATH|nr:hypothetical protein FRX31_012493 [Thalictrum thalictroides]
MEFCRGFSQYGWSIWIIVMTQIVTITLGAFAINLRKFALFFNLNDEVTDIQDAMEEYMVTVNFTYGTR